MNTSPGVTSLADELAALQQAIRNDAASSKLRIHLFQLLCVTGQWQRALSQLQLCAQMDVKSLPMAQTYREAIRMELFRAEVFAGKRTPQVMGQPPKWIGPLIEALKVESGGDAKGAAALRARALEEAEPRPCKVDGVAVEWFCDGDARLGPVLEIIANGQYYWLPFESCQGVLVEAPVDLRDLVWAPGEVMLPNQGRIPVLIPTRYPGTDASESDALRRSQSTEWKDIGDDNWIGLGPTHMDERYRRTSATEHKIDCVCRQYRRLGKRLGELRWQLAPPVPTSARSSGRRAIGSNPRYSIV